MRWFVEISPLGTKGGNDAILCVEAPQWQPALQKARALRGDNGALSNFSIELLEEGYRAIDPSTRLRYIVRRAPDDAQVTHSGLSEAPPPVSSPPAHPTPKSSAATPSDPPKKRAPAPTVAYASKGSASVNPPPAAPAPAAEIKKRPPAQTMAFASSGDAHVEAAAPAPVALPEPPRPAPAAALTPPVASKAAEPAPARAAEALPSFVVIGSREDNPTDASPLTYREYVYAVAPGTPEEDARRLIFERFEHVRSTLDATRTGRLINLAVFDHIFHGRPQRRPVVTLAWKDWKAEDPEVRYPQRDAPASSAAPTVKPAVDPPAAPKAAAPAAVLKAAAPVVVKAPEPAVVKAPAAATSTLSSAKPVVLPKLEPDSQVSVVDAAPVAAKAAPAVATPVQAAPAAKAASPSAPANKPAAAPAESAPETRPVPTTVTPRAATPVVATPAEAAPSATKSAAAPATAAPATAAPAAAAPPAAKTPAAAAPIAVAPVVAVAAATPAVAAVPSAAVAKPAVAPAPAARPRTSTGQGAAPRPDVTKKRLKGDDLLAELFEAFGDLHFARDSLEGAEFVLHLTLEKLPSEVGLISLFDMNKREFVVVRQVGGPRSALCARQPEKADLAFAAMRKRHALVISDAADAARAMDDRWRAIGVELKSLVCTPVELSGRYLGLIELANPTDGQAFNEGDGNALTYIGQQFAEFVAGKGVIVDPAQIREEPAPSAPPPPTSSPRSSGSPSKKGR